MRRSQIYTEEQVRDFDHLWSWKDIVSGFGSGISDVLGTRETVVTTPGALQTSSPSLSINLGAFSIYAMSALDATDFGSLPSDSTPVYQQGFAPAQTVTITPTVASGQSQWVLIQATYEQVDSVRATDPDSGVLPYVNTLNVLDPLFGPGGSGGTQATQRDGVASVSVAYGTPATTGSQVAPLPGGNAVGMYLILITFGQTAITNGEILPCAPSVGTGVSGSYPYAPFLTGVTGHGHTGHGVDGEQIDLTKGVTNILPLANSTCTNATPPSVGGIVVASPGMAVITIVNASPVGVLAGRQGDLSFFSGQQQYYVCTADGTPGTWVAVSLGGLTDYINSFSSPFAPSPGNFTYLCDTTGFLSAVVDLLAAASMGGTSVTLINIGPNALTITPNGSEKIFDPIDYASPLSTYVLQTGQSITLAPRSASGYYII
jgi:hypothetical protein